MLPRGLAAAILALNLGSDAGLTDKLMGGLDGFFENITFVVILGTAIICTIGVSFIAYYEKQKMQQDETPHNDIDMVIEKNNSSK
jgi:hypothetical protein